MYVIADVHDAVLTNPESSVTWSVSLSRLLISTPDGPSLALRVGRSSFPPGYERLNSLIVKIPALPGRACGPQNATRTRPGRSRGMSHVTFASSRGPQTGPRDLPR